MNLQPDFRPDDTLAIVTGTNGAVGQAYAEELSRQSIRTIGIVRTLPKTKISSVEYYDDVDLLDGEKVRRTIESIGCSDALRLLLVHPVGKFKFENQPTDTIDQEVLLSNYATLEHVLYPLLENVRQQARITVCGFGSVSDKYDVPFWRSYTAAKNKLRTLLQELSRKLMSTDVHMRSVMVNVSTTDTGNENILRPNADTSHWLKPAKIVEQSLPVLLGNDPSFYQEIDVIEPVTGFSPEEYYKNPQEVLAKWRKEMGN